MGHGLDDLAKHNAWATRQILATCRDLDEPMLTATVPGTYGTIVAILRHIIDSEAGYLFRLGAFPAYPWQRSEEVGLDLLAEREETLATTWNQFLAGDVDTDRLGEATGDKGEIFAIPAGIFITQALHHGTEHRAQICTILGANGHEPPDVSAWGYASNTGRSWVTSPSPDS